MSFIRTKEINGNNYLYLVKNKREGGTVKQEVIQYIGPAGSSAPDDIKEEYRDNLEQDQLDKLGTTQEENQFMEFLNKKVDDDIDRDYKRQVKEFKEKSKVIVENVEDSNKYDQTVYVEIPEWLAKKKNIGEYSVGAKGNETNKAILLKGVRYLKKKRKGEYITHQYVGDVWIPKSQIEEKKKLNN